MDYFQFKIILWSFWILKLSPTYPKRVGSPQGYFFHFIPAIYFSNSTASFFSQSVHILFFSWRPTFSTKYHTCLRCNEQTCLSKSITSTQVIGIVIYRLFVPTPTNERLDSHGYINVDPYILTSKNLLSRLIVCGTIIDRMVNNTTSFSFTVPWFPDLYCISS